MNYFLLVVLPHLSIWIEGISVFFFIVLCIPLFLCGMASIFEENEKERKEAFMIVKRVLLYIMIPLFVSFLTVLIPTKTEILQLKTISIMQEVKGLDSIPQKVVDKINNLLDMGKNE